jgi:hypothetical protein
MGIVELFQALPASDFGRNKERKLGINIVAIFNKSRLYRQRLLWLKKD